MLFDNGLNDKKFRQEINELVGSEYRFVDFLFRRKATCESSRMEVSEFSKLFHKIICRNQKVTAKINLRPHGVIVILNARFKTYTWVIPCRHLSVSKKDELVIQGQGEYLTFKVDGNKNQAFLNKLMLLESSNQ